MPLRPTPFSALRNRTRVPPCRASSAIYNHPSQLHLTRRTQHQNRHSILNRRTPSTFYSTSTSNSTPALSPPRATHKPLDLKRPEKPEYEVKFTCRPCSTRSTHRVSKQGYHFGSVLVTCPGCKNRHVISDHLNIFGGRKLTIEDLMREQGQRVKKGTLGEDGDVEFWDDGTTTTRAKTAEDDGQEPQGREMKGQE